MEPLNDLWSIIPQTLNQINRQSRWSIQFLDLLLLPFMHERIPLMPAVDPGLLAGTLHRHRQTEPLRENPSGCWSRRIDDEHRLVYRVEGRLEASLLVILACRDHDR